MFTDKTKNKIAIVQVRKAKLFDVTQITEVIYDKRTKDKIESNGVAAYPGDPQAEATWRHYQLKLDVDGKDQDTEYYTEEQYKACWKPNTMADYESDFFWPDWFRPYIIYEQDHYGNRPRKEKNPENRYLEENLPKFDGPNYFPKSMELLKQSWAEKRKAAVDAANKDK